MKKYRLYVRLTEPEFQHISNHGGKNKSAWIRSRLFPITFHKVEIAKSGLPIVEAKQEVLEAKPRHCIEPYCKSTDVEPVMIHGMKTYLCRDHRNSGKLAKPF